MEGELPEWEERSAVGGSRDVAEGPTTAEGGWLQVKRKTSKKQAVTCKQSIFALHRFHYLVPRCIQVWGEPKAASCLYKL